MTWIFVFIFNGAIYTSGPHDAERCAYLISVQSVKNSPVCINQNFPALTMRPKED